MHRREGAGNVSGLWRGYLAVLVVAGIVYFVTVAPGSLWQDSGIAQNRTLAHDLRGVRGLALSHPLYYLLTIWFQHLPFHEPALKTNLVSAVFGAITVANVVLLLRLWTQRWFGAVVGGISVGVAHTFWQHCALAEVYTVTTTFLTVELICAQRYFETRRPRWLILLFFANGVGISNHMLASLSFVCDATVLLWALVRREIRFTLVPALAIVWLAGASLYLWLIAKDLSHGVGFMATLASASTGGYAQNVLNGIPSRKQLLNSAMYLGLNFPTPAVALLIWALVTRAKDERQARFERYLMLETAIYLVWAVRYDVPDQYTFFIPIIVLIGIWIGRGACAISPAMSGRWRTIVVLAAFLPAAVYAPLPMVARRAHLNLGTSRSIPYRDEYQYLLWPWKTRYHGPDRFVAALKETLPAGSIVILDDTCAEPVWYAETMGRWSADIEMLSIQPRATEARRTERSAYLLRAQQEGRLYVLTPLRNYCPEWILEEYQFEKVGMVSRVLAREPSTQTATRPAHS